MPFARLAYVRNQEWPNGSSTPHFGRKPPSNVVEPSHGSVVYGAFNAMASLAKRHIDISELRVVAVFGPNRQR